MTAENPRIANGGGQKICELDGPPPEISGNIERGKLYSAGLCFDPLSARIAEHLGFEMGLFPGSTAAPDLVLLTATQLVQQAQRICRVVSIWSSSDAYLRCEAI